MPVKVITDSVADLPKEIVDTLGVIVVPLLVRFGEKEYRDGIDLSVAEFYSLLDSSPDFPAASFPPPAAFADAYSAVVDAGDEAVVVTISTKLSGTYNAAVAAKKMVSNSDRIEVVDAGCAAMAQGFVAMKAAETAIRGGSLEEAAEAAKKARDRAHLLATFQTLEYLHRGGRIGKAKAFFGSALKVQPLIGLKDGLVQPFGAARSREKGIEKLIAFVGRFTRIEELGVEHGESPDEAAMLVERLSKYHPKERIHVSEMTPVIGSHTGRGILVVCVLGDRN
jgi:DegV family protein with EDD domain